MINPYQPRRDFDESALEELTQSIRVSGIIQPLVVRRTDKGYELIAGERRLRAAKRVGLKSVPIVIRRSTDRESLELALIENIQRQNLNCIDEAVAYSQLLTDFSLTQEEVATRVGKDRATVANHLRLLRLSEEIQRELRKQTLSFGHGKVLLSVDNAEVRSRLFREISERKLSVREAEKRATELQEEAQRRGEAAPASGAKSAQKQQLADRLSLLSADLTRTLSARVELKGSDRRGKIVVHYGTREDLDRLLAAMQNREIWQPGRT
ncbi:MAG: ParB/RepB/Spo0J family partition protein [Bdellovibrionales bacterium]|nr:ParB/RepB/Spo0J family partition protein [Bdellovibrionales bacterium]